MMFGASSPTGRARGTGRDSQSIKRVPRFGLGVPVRPWNKVIKSQGSVPLISRLAFYTPF